MVWWMDLLTTYTHDWELQVITKLSLISSLYKSLYAKSSLVCSVFTSRCLVTNHNIEDSSASVFTSLLSGEYPTTEAPSLLSLPCRTQLWTNWVEVEVTLRLTVSQSNGAHDQQICITIWQLRSCFCGAPSLTRGRVCLLYMLLAFASALTGSPQLSSL
jgi:hypothetical protein